MAEHGLDDIVAITCDGYGYGSDGGAWGGEILYCKNNSTIFERLGNLEPQQLLGGDLASRYPIRIAAAMLYKAGINIQDWLAGNSQHLPHGMVEAKLISDQLSKGGAMETTSCGRVLDAVSAILNLCHVRSYEGESAMKLESAAMTGCDSLDLKPQIHGKVLGTTNLLEAIFDKLGKLSTPDLAYSTHVYLAKGLAALATEQASLKGVKNIGFSGGAACNKFLTELIGQNVRASGFNFLVHEIVPAGDGGVSFGQAVVAGFGDF
jgi:hydrogenase maturation protein HypF